MKTDKSYDIIDKYKESGEKYYAVVCFEDGNSQYSTIFTSENYSECMSQVSLLELKGIIDEKERMLNNEIVKPKINQTLLEVSTACLQGLLHGVGQEFLEQETADRYITESILLAKTLIKKVQDVS